MTMLSLLNRNALILVFIVISTIPLLLFDTTKAMINVWMINETFTHGFLVFPISLWLIWQKKNQLLLFRPNPEARVFVLLVSLLFGWFVSAIVDVQVAQQLIMISIIIITVWLVVGYRIAGLVLFPLLFLYFAVPFGQSLIPPLMDFTADFTVLLIQLSGIPVYREGLFFSLPSGSWSVVEECSGVRYLIASFTLGSIYAYINYSSLKKRIFFILLSLIVPIVGNGLRAYGIVMIGHLSGMELAVGADHLLYGWVFFGVIIFLLFYLGSFWWDSAESFALDRGVTRQDERNEGVVVRIHSFLYLLLALSLIAITYSSIYFVAQYKQDQVKPVSLSLPIDFSGWQFDESRSLKWQPLISNPDEEISKGYNFGNDFVQLNIGFYQAQRQGAEVISSMNSIASPLGGEWKKIRSSEIYDSGMYFYETELRGSDGSNVLVWHWYKIGLYNTPNAYIAKVVDAFNLIVKGRTDASLITLATVLDENKELSRKRLKDFWNDASVEINENLERLVVE